MDRIFSTRIDDRILLRINDLARNLRISKKAVIEKSIELFGKKVEEETKTDVFDQTNGAWNRSEPPEKIVHEVRSVFRKSMHRHKR